ncbi:TonB-dependent receptor plug domain-containing protein [Portibacter lacus]|uniref:Catecholate siderophore receptor CirA n=1 Tax=Portibacter lacus TaxID=1099794 RepID=A0AA37WDI3_9BACT|nr:TonB-dependent receptor [Portibacter lacus]GLR16933.1 catecholate siderophore receptor CirA [Portibacter lacus]
MYRLLAFLICLTIFSKLLGQEESENLDTIAFSVEMEDFVVTGQYRPTHYKKVVHNIDIIDNNAILKRGALSLESAISISPAIRLYEDPILGTTIRMRGISSSNVAILIDGVPVIGRQNGSIDLSQIAMQNVDRIEVVEGPLSNIYGSNAAGGVINIITKKSQLNTFALSVESQLESIGIQNHIANVGYKVGKLNLKAFGRFYKYDQFPSDSLRLYDEGVPRYPFNPKVQNGYGGLVRYDFNEEHNLVFKYNGNNEHVEDLGSIKRPKFNPYANDLFYHTNRNDFSAIYKGRVNSKFFIDGTAAYNLYDRVKEDTRYYLETQDFDHEFKSADTTLFRTYFSRLNTAYIIDDNWSLMSGFNYNHESGAGDRIVSENKRDSTTAISQEAAIYSEITWKAIDDFQLVLSGRWTIHSLYKNRVTPSLQWKYDISKRWAIKGGYAQGYRSPSLKELYLEFIDINHNIVGNTSLEPEISHDIQNTLHYNSENGWNGGINVYFTQINNRINLTETETLKFIYDNIDQYKVFGIQPKISYETEKITVQSAASLGSWATNIEQNDAPKYGNVVDMNNSISYEIPKAKVGLLLNHRLVGGQPIYRLEEEEVSVSRIASYNMMDITMNRSFYKNRILIVGGVKNLLNVQRTDITSGTSTGAHTSSGSNAISQGRSWFVKLRLSM